jgi:hypothetical protein
MRIFLLKQGERSFVNRLGIRFDLNEEAILVEVDELLFEIKPSGEICEISTPTK